MIIGKFLGIVVLLLSLIISFLIIKKIVKAKNKFIRIVFSVLIFLVIIAVMSSLFVSSVNFICKFDTAESAFKFNHSEEIINIVDGESSCMIIYKKQKNVNGIYYLNKSEKGYKFPHSFISQEIDFIVFDNCTISISKIRGTNDYYVFGSTFPTKTEPTVIDNNDESVQKNIVQSFDGNIITAFYDYIDNYETDDYYLIINDEKINITNAGTQETVPRVK